MRLRHLAAGAAALVFVAACAQLRSDTPPAAKPVIGTWGFDASGIDTTVQPGDDFFRYANGTWMATTEIPADRTSWGAFDQLLVKSEAEVKAIIDELTTKQNAPGSVEQQIGDYYNSYVDTAAIEAAGLAPFEADLAAIAALKSHDEVASLMGRPDIPTGGPVALAVGLDNKNPDRYSMEVTQAGLGLPDRDYYLKPDAEFAAIRAEYRAYIEKMLTLAGYDNPAKSADAIMKLETRIAELQWPYEKQRNRDLTYNPKTRAELIAFAPEYPWQETLDTLGIPTQDFFNINETDAIQKLAKLFRKTPVSTWRAYVTFHYLDGLADIMPVAFDDARFAFRGKVLNGQQVKRERWKRATQVTSGALGEAIGQVYVARHFSPEAKAGMVQLVENLRAAYRERILKLEWMSPETQQIAVRKLETLRVKIGYPDRWKDYSALEVIAGDPLGNRKRAALWQWNYDSSRLNQPTDKDEWFMPPQQVNAYYNPTFNEIVFPAAILQAPFFDLAADPAINYGAIGGVIGHEMGHGFDDQGAKSDENGVLRTWWKAEDEERFRALTGSLIAQYSAFEALPGLFVKGENTIGENIGDLGGLSVALEAYRISLNGKPAAVIDGFTGEQRFFFGWAQVWRDKMRDEAMRTQVTADEHSPPEFRVNGPVRNMDEWYAAFGVQESNKLYLPTNERVHIW